MLPYLSIIKDSFRAATASRVLYVLLGCITLFLLVLAPIWVNEELAWRISEDRDVTNIYGLSDRIVEASRDDDEPLVRHVWQRLSDELRDDLRRYYDRDRELEASGGEDDPFGDTGIMRRARTWTKLVGELNEIIQQDDFYDPEIFGDRLLAREAQALIDQGVDTLTPLQRNRLNRLLMENCLSPFIRQGPASALGVSYLHFSPDWLTFNQTRGELHRHISSWLPWVLDKFVLSAGLLIAVLITASLIPEMLQSNSLNLLLSKPISRTGLLISKFVGGCAFIAILATYLFIGLWLLMGLRVGYWDSALLLSIPVYIFVFAIYFSVSMLVGILFRNTILCMLLTLVFWGVCWGVGTMYGFFDNRMSVSHIVRVEPAGEALFHVDRLGVPYRWDEEANNWSPALYDEGMQFMSTFFYVASFFARDADSPPPVGPAYDPNFDVVAMGQFDFQRPESIDRRMLAVSNQQLDWEPLHAGHFPRNTVALFSTPGLGLVAVNGSGRFYRLSSDPIAAAEAAREEQQTPLPEGNEPPPPPIGNRTSEAATGGNVDTEPDSSVLITPRRSTGRQRPGESGAVIMNDGGARQVNSIPDLDLFEEIGPDRRVNVFRRSQIDINPRSLEIAIYWRGTIHLFAYEDGQYRATEKITPELGVDSAMSAWLVYRGDTLLLALGNGEIITIDRRTYAELNTYLPSRRSSIRAVDGSPDGRWFTVTYRNGELWVLDMESPQQMHRAPIWGQRSISIGQFDVDGRLWVGHHIDYLTCYDPSDWSAVERYAPRGDWLKWIYRYGVRPLYQAFPKPGEFYKLVAHLSDTGGTRYDRDMDLATQQEPERPWDPFRSGLIFMLAMLAISCLLFRRQEF